MTMRLPGVITCKTKVFGEIDNPVKEWVTCHLFLSMNQFEINGKEYLLEGCSICKVIRGYNLPQIESKIFCEGISPDAMCQGPDGTILVFDSEIKSLKQLGYCDGQFLLVKQFPVERVDVHSLCFVDGIVIVIYRDLKTLTGFHFPSRQVAWQHNYSQLDSSSQFTTIFQQILTLPDGRVCIFTIDEVFALNPVDGTILYKLDLLSFQGSSIRTVATCCNGNQQKLAICTYPMTVSVYDVPYEVSEISSFLPLKDIVFDKENTVPATDLN